MMRVSTTAAALLVAMGLVGPFARAQVDPKAMEKWTSAKTIFYRVEGSYAKRTAVAYSDLGAVADVTDRVAFDMEWDLGNGKLVKVGPVRNVPAEAKNVANGEPKCMPPVLKGRYDQSVLGIAEGFSGDVVLTIETSWPDVEVVQVCSGSRRLVRARKESRQESVMVASPILLGMPASSGVTVSPDRKSIIVKTRDWSWTFTPSVTRPAK
ncbi:MAG: hypothetical protein ACYDBY_01850 [Thermoanaerobaculia bacterium]